MGASAGSAGRGGLSLEELTFLQLDLHHPTKPLNLVLGDLKYVEGFSSHLSFV